MRIFTQNAYKLLKCTLIASIFSILLVASSSAQGVQDFVITSFDASYELTNEDPQGLLKITETIELNFSGQNQGILRAIPNDYKGNKQNVKIVSVQRATTTSAEAMPYRQEPYFTYLENGNLIVRIGQAGVYITGPQSYELTYEVENVITFYDDYDELFWDINGDQWLQPFVTVSVEARTSARIRDPGVICYAGANDSKEQSCDVTSEATVFSVNTTRALDKGETLSVVAAFEKDYFTPLSWWEVNKNFVLVSPIFLLQAAAGRSAYKKWKKYGKDYKKRGITVPYFGRPKNVSVMQAAYVVGNKFVATHITASIVDLAIRGYIQITEKKDGRIVTHELTIVKVVDETLTDDEQTLIKEIFGSASVGNTIKLENEKNKLYKAVTKLSKLIDESMFEKGYYELSPTNAYKKIGSTFFLSIVAIVIGFAAASYSQGTTAITSIVLIIVVIVFTALMSKRSKSGMMLVEHMEGLKLYLKQAEKDRIQQQDAVEAPLAVNSGQPVRDVKFFEKLLPYAIVMGVEKSWAGAFKDIYTQPPEWYGGNWNTFTTAALISGIANTNAATVASFSAPASSSGSGFSGGGGAGGGGGGGGGGGW